MLTKEDDDVSDVFTRRFSQDHTVLLETTAVRAWKDEEQIALEVERKPTRERRTLRADALLIATGITPNSDTLDLAKTGVETDKRGFIKVDLTLQTNVPGIWAFGDAIGRFPFKHNANHEARYLIENLQHPESPATVDYHAMPHAVFSDPQVAAVGCSEQDLRHAGVAYEVARYDHKDTAMGRALGEEHGFVKFLARPEDGCIMGCHIIGPEASILIHEVLAVMRSGGNTLEDIAETIHIHPALSEVVQRAAQARR